jgi:hypothetical protein
MNIFDWHKKNPSWYKDKKILYPALTAVVILLIILGFWLFLWHPQQVAKQAAIREQQKAAQALADKRKNATYSRPSFFLNLPKGAMAAFNVPSYLEGQWRMIDTGRSDKKMTVVYIKNPSYAAPLFYIRYDDKANFKLTAGEVELKTDSTKYFYAYYFYPVDSYTGADKADFSSMQTDFQTVLKTFSIF